MSSSTLWSFSHASVSPRSSSPRTRNSRHRSLFSRGTHSAWTSTVIVCCVLLLAHSAWVEANLSDSDSDSSSCVSGLVPCSRSVTGNLLLLLFYGAIMGYGAKCISDGSELLLDVWSEPGIIGGFILPTLGAIPDAAIVVASGATGSVAEAQEQLSVGVGTLAGSTIMLLTISYSLSLVIARCDLDEKGDSIDETLTRGFDLQHTGATVDSDVRMAAIVAMVTSMIYFVIQGVAFEYQSSSSDVAAEREKNWALAAFILCVVAFVSYSIYQVLNTSTQEKVIACVTEQHKEERRIHAILHQTTLYFKFTSAINAGGEEKKELLSTAKAGAKWLSRVRAKKTAGNSSLSYGSENALLNSEVPSVNDVSVPAGEEASEEEELTRGQIWFRIIFFSTFGLILVSVFSDPMVDVISALGEATTIPSFYLSFIFTPFCSNASEFISSLIFASKKKRSNTTITFSQLFGAAVMNNTMVLGIFVALVYFRGLAWTFSAEVLAIFSVTIVVGLLSLTKTLKLWKVIPSALMYPLSILLVWVLETTLDWK